MRHNLTDRWVRSVKPTSSTQLDYWDSEMRCFGLRVSLTGRKTWTVYYRFHKRKRRLSLGTVPECRRRRSKRTRPYSPCTGFRRG